MRGRIGITVGRMRFVCTLGGWLATSYEYEYRARSTGRMRILVRKVQYENGEGKSWEVEAGITSCFEHRC